MNNRTSAIFVFHPKLDDLDRYLEACPAGQRHLAFLTQRPGSRPALSMSRLLVSFLAERGVDILETRGIDEALDQRRQ